VLHHDRRSHEGLAQFAAITGKGKCEWVRTPSHSRVAPQWVSVKPGSHEWRPLAPNPKYPVSEAHWRPINDLFGSPAKLSSRGIPRSSGNVSGGGTNSPLDQREASSCGSGRAHVPVPVTNVGITLSARPVGSATGHALKIECGAHPKDVYEWRTRVIRRPICSSVRAS